MENWLDACESRWLRRIMRIAYKDSITNETIRQQVPMSNRSRLTDAIKMVRACVMDESQHTDQKCTSNREMIKRTTEENMDELY